MWHITSPIVIFKLQGEKKDFLNEKTIRQIQVIKCNVDNIIQEYNNYFFFIFSLLLIIWFDRCGHTDTDIVIQIYSKPIPRPILKFPSRKLDQTDTNMDIWFGIQIKPIPISYCYIYIYRYNRILI